MADGSIRISTKIDTSGAEKDLGKLHREVEKTAEAIEQAGAKVKTAFTGMTSGQLSAEFKRASRELEKINAQLDEVQSEIASIEAATDEMLPQAATDDQAAKLLEMEAFETQELIAKRTQLEQKAAHYESILQRISAEIQRQKQIEATKAQEQKKLIENQERLKQKVKETEVATKSWGRTGTQSMRRMTSEINRGIRRLARMSLAMMGVEGVFSIIRRASMQAMENNETLANQIKGIWNVLATAIEPVVVQVVNWLTIAITYINAVIKALTGTDLIANANAKALERQAKATEGVTDATYAAAAAQEELQTAGFDEMNKLSDTSASGGGVGGGASADTGTVEGLFDPAEINGDVDKMLEKFKSIAGVVAAIGAGIAAWKIASSLGLPLLSCLGWATALAGVVLSLVGFFRMWTEGINWDNLLMTLLGIGVAIGGFSILFGSIGTAIASIVGGVLLLVAGIKDLVANGWNWENLVAIEAGILLIGGAIALLTGHWIPLAVAGAIQIGVAIWALVTMFKEDLVNAAKAAWQWISDTFTAAKEWVMTKIVQPLATFFAPLIEAAQSAWKWIKENMITPLRDFFVEVGKTVKEASQIIIEKFREIGAKVKEIFQALWWAFKEYVWTPIREKVIAAWASIKEKVFDPIIAKVKEIWGIFKTNVLDKIKAAFQSVGAWVKAKIIDPIIDKVQWLYEKAVEILKKVGTATVDFIQGTVKAVINGVLSGIESAINGFIRMLNGAIGLINKIPGVDISTVSLMYLPRLARGGIVNNPGVGVPAVIGEAGREAILPLDNHTEWMDELASRLGANGNVTIQLILSGKKIYETMVDLAQKRQFATNGGAF